MLEGFLENSKQLLAVNYFDKKLHHRCLKGPKYSSVQFLNNFGRCLSFSIEYLQYIYFLKIQMLFFFLVKPMESLNSFRSCDVGKFNEGQIKISWNLQ